MKRHESRFDPKSCQAKETRSIENNTEIGRNVEVAEQPTAGIIVKYEEKNVQRECRKVRCCKIYETSFLHFFLFFLQQQTEIRHQRHQFPEDKKHNCMVCKDEELS